jgi:hypothetical protein
MRIGSSLLTEVSHILAKKAFLFSFRKSAQKGKGEGRRNCRRRFLSFFFLLFLLYFVYGKNKKRS